MNPLYKRLVHRVEALERKARKAAPQDGNKLLEMSITAMASAWTSEEVEQMLAASERSQLNELPQQLRRRWIRHLNFISLVRCGRTFGELLASRPAASNPLASPAESSQSEPKGRIKLSCL